MFSRMLLESLVRQRARKGVAVLAVWIGVSLVAGLMTLGLDVGDKMNRELRSFGANIRITPASAAIPVRVGGYELASTAEAATLEQAKLEALKNIFWANNILEVVPRLRVKGRVAGQETRLLGIPPDHRPAHWQIQGAWPPIGVGGRPLGPDECLLGADLAGERGLTAGQSLTASGAAETASLRIRGVIHTGDGDEQAVIVPLAMLQQMSGLAGKISEAEVSALTTPENRLAERYRLEPSSLTPAEYERWACTPYPGSVALNIQEAVPGSVARVVRRVSESQGAVLTRIRGLVTLLAWLAAMACALSVMGVLTSSVLERQTEVALLQAMGASGGNVLRLFLAEAGVLGLAGGALAAGTGSLLGARLVQAVFGAPGEPHGALVILSPAMGVLVALAATALPVRHTLRRQTAQVLHGN